MNARDLPALEQPPSGAKGGGCFAAGTLILLEGGRTIPIEQLAPGDKVLGFDEQGSVRLQTVVKVHRHDEPQPVLEVGFWGGRVRCTPNHWVQNQFCSFAEIGRLTVDDALIDGMGHLRPITGRRALDDAPVWNLTVEPNHTFIADGVRVHNGGHRLRYPVVAGAKGGGGDKGGGGTQRAAVEDPDSLRSISYAELIDAVSEGEIVGLVDGLKSIYLDDTPVQAADGSMNFQNLSYETRVGTQSQPAIGGISDQESVTQYGVRVQNGAPVTRSITNPNATAARVTIAIPQLISQDTSTGDVHGTTVQWSVEYKPNGGSFIPVDTITVTGKASSAYLRETFFQLTGSAPWDIRVTRITADSGSGALLNQTWLDTITEVVQTKLRYPNTALMSFVIDAKQFQSIPTRGYRMKGLKVKVPSNYNPVTRAYTGSWDGTFVVAWTDNPAWCFYDLLTTGRYGLGNYIPAASVDKWALYAIGQYCDQLVPNGFGGTEPRFTCNLYLQERAEAFNVVANMAAIFRGMAYWGNGAITAVQDSPSDAVANFVPANVIDGMFTYQGTSLKTRHTVAIVVWNDPSDMYRQRREYVADEAGIALYGVRETEVAAVGCTSRGQAHRAGKWLLYSERLETESVSFKVGLDAAMLRPGSIIQISDPARTGLRMGGRCASGSSVGTVKLDHPVSIEVGKSYVLHAMKSDGTVMSSTVTNAAPASTSEITVTPDMAEAPQAEAVWILEANDAVPTLWRVLAVAEGEKNQFEVVALSHNAGKFASVEQDVILAVPPSSSLRMTPRAPENIVVEESLYVAGQTVRVRATVFWDASPLAANYIIRYRRDYGPWEVLPMSDGPTVDINDCSEGFHEFYVSSVTPDGQRSTEVYASYTVIGKTAPPSNIAGFNYAKQSNGLLLFWDKVTDLDLDVYEIRVGASWAAGATIYKGTATQFLYQQLPSANYTFWAKALDTSGNYSTLETRLDVAVNAPGAVSPSSSISDQDYVLAWATPSSDWPLDHYEIRYGATWAGGTLIAKHASTNFRAAVSWSGTRKFWVVAVDVVGNESTPASTDLTVNAAPAPTVARSYVGPDVLLAWGAVAGSLPVVAYEIRYGSDWASGAYVANITALVRQLRVDWQGSRTFWVAAIDTSGAYGTAGSVVVNPTAHPAPAVSSSVIGVKAALAWTLAAGGSLPVDYFEIRYGASWAAGVLVSQVKGDNFRVPIDWLGSRDFYMAARDSAGNYGTPTSAVNVTINAPSAPTVNGTFLLDQVVLTWNEPASTLPIVEYAVRYGAAGSAWGDNAATEQRIKGTRLELKAQWLGDRVYFIAGVDYNGNVGSAGQKTLSVTAPSQPAVLAQVVDNNVLIYWTLPSSTLPVLTYEIRRGATWAGGTVIGTKTGLFTSVFETVSGLFTYWVAGIDTAGNYGTPGSITAQVAQPPDYILQADYDSTFSGTLSNALLEQDTVLLPVETSRTWAQHFTDNGWTTIADQIAAGYPLYIQPNVASGYYEEVIDYGSLLAAMKVTLAYGTQAVSGSPTVEALISLSDDGMAWTDYPGVNSVFGTNFRYIKVRITATRALATDLVRITTMNVRLDAKLISDAGTLTAYANISGATYVQTGTSCVVTSNAHGKQVGDWVALDFTSGTATDGDYQITAKDANTFTVTAPSATTSGNVNVDTNGTPVKFHQTFIDVAAITPGAGGTTNRNALYNFTDVPNPTTFYALLYDSAGARATGEFSWQAKGY